MLHLAMQKLGYEYARKHDIRNLTDAKEVLKHVEYSREQLYLPDPKEYYAKQFMNPSELQGMLNHCALEAFGFKFVAKLHELPGYTYLPDTSYCLWFHQASKLHLCTRDSKYIYYDTYEEFPERQV